MGVAGLIGLGFSIVIHELAHSLVARRFDMPIRGVAPNGNRADPNAYKNGNDILLSNFRNRDEIFLRLRWTF